LEDSKVQIAAVGGAYIGFLILGLYILGKLRDYRVDLAPNQSEFEGRSRIWQLNVLRPSNYDVHGKRWLFWYCATLVVQVMCAGLLLYILIQ
jgi:hypothetical protein